MLLASDRPMRFLPRFDLNTSTADRNRDNCLDYRVLSLNIFIPH